MPQIYKNVCKHFKTRYIIYHEISQKTSKSIKYLLISIVFQWFSVLFRAFPCFLELARARQSLSELIRAHQSLSELANDYQRSSTLIRDSKDSTQPLNPNPKSTQTADAARRTHPIGAANSSNPFDTRGPTPRGRPIIQDSGKPSIQVTPRGTPPPPHF